MKKTLLSALAILGLSLGATAQIEIYVDGGATDYAGGGVFAYHATGDSDQLHEIHMENHSGSSQDMIVSRRLVGTHPASWTDYLCWGHQTDQFGGLCIDAVSMDMELYTMPGSGAVTLADGEYGFVSSHITPSFNDPGTYTFRYYVGTDQNPYMDSVDFEVTLTPLTIEEKAPELSIGVKPNPATDYMVVTANGVESANVRVIDVLGNVVHKSTVSGSKNIDVSEYRNGIYFVMIESKGTKVSRKVFIRH